MSDFCHNFIGIRAKELQNWEDLKTGGLKRAKGRNQVAAVQIESQDKRTKKKKKESNCFEDDCLNTLTLSMLNLGIPCFENGVDPDQLAFKKPVDQHPHCFPFCMLI